MGVDRNKLKDPEYKVKSFNEYEAFRERTLICLKVWMTAHVKIENAQMFYSL